MSSAPETPAPRRGLGRGLELLVGGQVGGGELLHLPVDAIHANPRQPRKRFEPEATAGLAASLRHQGVLQPVVVRPRSAGGYELIAGERRWRAAREAGLETLPSLVRETDDRETLLLGLVENVAREDLSPVEEARAYAVLVDEFELSLGEVAERVGRSKPGVSNRLRLLELPEDVLWMLARGELTEGHARAVLSIPDDDGRRRLARRVARDGSHGARDRARRAGRRREAATPRDPGRPDPRGARPRRGAAPHGACRRASRRASSSSTSETRSASRSSSRRSKRCSACRPGEDFRPRSRPLRGSRIRSVRMPRLREEMSGRSWTRTRGLRLIRAAL